MSDSMSEADKIRNKRLAKLGGQPSAKPSSTDKAESSSSSSAAAAPPVAPSESAGSQQPQDQGILNAPSVSDSLSQLEAKPDRIAAPRINITPTPRPASADEESQKRKRDAPERSRSRQDGRDSIEAWEDRTLGAIFRITLNPETKQDAHGNALQYLSGVRSDLEDDGTPIRFSTGTLDQAILEAASNLADKKPLDYLLGCWKRVSRLFRGMRTSDHNDPKYQILKEARRLCMSYCIFAVTMPDMFGLEPLDTNPLAKHLLVDPENDVGICHDFLSEAVSRMAEDSSIVTALIDAMEQLSRELSKLSMNGDYKPYVLALRNFVRYPPLVDALTRSAHFTPKGELTARSIENDTFLGPFFQLSPLQGDVALNYFSNPKSRDKAYIFNSQKALRMTLQTHQDELFDIVNHIIKASKASREQMLDWFALTVNTNHKRRAMRVDPEAVSSDGFMVNVTVCLDRLCEPFMDATFSKIDRIDAAYLRRSPRITIEDETKINADKSMSDRFYSQKVEGSSNFISEVFFLTVAAHHYGTEAANTKLSQLQKDMKYLEKRVEEFEAERSKFSHNPAQLQAFENALKKYKTQIERGYCVVHATQGVLLDELAQARSMQFMRYVIVWMLRLVSAGVDYPKHEIPLPLPEEQPDVFRCLPEYFLEDIVDNFKFITSNMPQIITSSQCEELITICITFLRSSEYIKSPYLKSGLVTILFHGVWPLWNRSKGVLGDLLNSMPFALKHLLHALMKFYIEAESTGTHNQFFDKFNIRYEIFQIIRCIWSNSIYRENLATEAKVNLEFFVRFVNLLLNDVTFVLDESFSAFTTIHDLQKELNDPSSTLSAEARTEKEEALAAAQGKAKGYMNITNETVSMLKLFTEALADSFTMPEIVQRLADMLDFNLDALVGKKQADLKIENPQEYGFNPKRLLADIIDVYLNLKDKPNFHLAVARDGRSYRPSNFEQAATIMKRFALKSTEELETWAKLSEAFKAAKEADDQEEEDLGEIPDEFLDPLVYTLMKDPVILPASRVTIDRSTIRSHLLSDPNDPFNRAPLKIEDVRPDDDLRTKIEAFVAEKKAKRVDGSTAEMMDVSA